MEFAILYDALSKKDTPRQCPPCPCPPLHVFNVHVHHGGHALETEEEVVWLMGTEIGCVNFSCG